MAIAHRTRLVQFLLPVLVPLVDTRHMHSIPNGRWFIPFSIGLPNSILLLLLLLFF